MKSLQEFKVDPLITEEEKTDYSKFDTLVRAGLANKAQMQRIHKILDKMQDDRPQFNNADRQILQNLFNKMVDLISNNKQIFQKTRQAVREEIELDERVLDTTDFKLGPTGKKVKAHRVKIGDIGYDISVDDKQVKESVAEGEPPFVLVLKRKAYRMYPNNLRVALYYNDKLDKYFSVPYIASDKSKVGSIVQAEEVEFEESVLDKIYHIAEQKKTSNIEFESGETTSVDKHVASAIIKVYESLNEENKNKMEQMMCKDFDSFVAVTSFAFNKK